MRYVVLGAGAIGGAIGGRLFQHGSNVVFVARGEHLAALERHGLELRDPDSTVRLDVEAAASVAAAKPREGDVVLLATKSQHTEPALAELAASAPSSIPVVCAQNGVANEPSALRRFAQVYGMRVVLAGTHLEPGVVEIATAPVSGVLTIGRYPAGTDGVTEGIVRDLRHASFDADAAGKVMEHKYLKLLTNLANALEAACGDIAGNDLAKVLAAAARREARACFEAAGIAVADPAGEAERRRLRGPVRPVGGVLRLGGSTFQSLSRRTGDVEADWLNGEIVLLGRLHGIPTPVNERLQQVATRLARTKAAPGSLSVAELAEGLI